MTFIFMYLTDSLCVCASTVLYPICISCYFVIVCGSMCVYACAQSLLSLFTPTSSCSLFHLPLFPVRLLDLFYLRLNVVFSISSLSVSSAIFASLPFRYIRISAYHMLIINNVCATCHRWKVFEWRNCHSIIKDLFSAIHSTTDIEPYYTTYTITSPYTKQKRQPSKKPYSAHWMPLTINYIKFIYSYFSCSIVNIIMIIWGIWIQALCTASHTSWRKWGKSQDNIQRRIFPELTISVCITYCKGARARVRIRTWCTILHGLYCFGVHCSKINKKVPA